MAQITFSQLEGKDVLSQDGKEMGAVDDLVLDDEGWTLTALVVKLDRDLLESFHMKRPMFGSQTVHVPVGFVSGVGDKVILHKKLDELTALGGDPSKLTAPPTDDSDEE